MAEEEAAAAAAAESPEKATADLTAAPGIRLCITQDSYLKVIWKFFYKTNIFIVDYTLVSPK